MQLKDAGKVIFTTAIPLGIYLFKVDKVKTRTIFGIETPERL